MTGHDAIILGSSPNALITAAYLARAGQKVLVLEPSAHIGGAFSTEEFAPGFKGDISFTSGRLDLETIKDLNLSTHGLEVIERASITSLLPGGKSFTLPKDGAEAAKVIGSISARDAERYQSFMALLDIATDFLSSAYVTTAPRQHPLSDDDAKSLSNLTGQLLAYGRRESTEVMRLVIMSVRDLMDEWFESPQLKGLLASVAVRGLNQGPFAGSTTFNLLHHLAIKDGYFRATARGGIGAISEALSRAAIGYGAEIRTGVGAITVTIDDGTATGVRAGQDSFEARAIISDFDAQQTFGKMVAPPELEPEFNRAVRNVRHNGTVTRINLALSELPKSAGLTEKELGGTLVVAPSLDYLERSFDGCKRVEMAEAPYMEVTIPTVLDSSLAPPGKHVMSIWLQHTPFRNNIKAERARDTALNHLSLFFPNLKSLVQHSQVITPQDFAARYGLTEGNLYGGEMTLSQAFLLRPIPGFAHYQTPIANLYLCGAATHPGGGVHGLCARNAVREIQRRELVLA